MHTISLEQRWQGLLLGLSVSDALGLPAEGLSQRRGARWYPGRWQHRLIGRWGLGSDDSEHAWLVTQSLLAQGQEADAFARRLAWGLRGWLLGAPAGIGLATLRAIIKLWCGYSPQHSGVYSAGNGAAMRVAPIGAFFAHDSTQRQAFVRASSRLTHTDERANTGALAIADTIAWIFREQPQQAPEAKGFCQHLRDLASQDEEWQHLLNTFEQALQKPLSVKDFAAQLGLSSGVTGYVYHTVPVALYAWYRHFGDFESSVQVVLNCGGDTDTVGAITGALAGSSVGVQQIPQDWKQAYVDWPRSRTQLCHLGQAAAQASQGQAQAPLNYFWPALLPRNLLFMLIVLAHGLRRLLPPY